MKTQIWTDPIVEEVRATREALAKENGYDLDRLADMVMKSQTRHGKGLVDRSLPERALLSSKKPAKARGNPSAVVNKPIRAKKCEAPSTGI